MYIRTIPLKKFSEKGKYTLHTIAHQTLLCILSHACSKSPEVAWELRKNKDHRKKYYSNFLGKYKVFIKSLWNINTRKLKVNCLCYKLWARNDRVPPRRDSPPQKIGPPPPPPPPATYPLLKFQESSVCGKYTTSKFSNPSNFRTKNRKTELDKKIISRCYLQLLL